MTDSSDNDAIESDDEYGDPSGTRHLKNEVLSPAEQSAIENLSGQKFRCSAVTPKILVFDRDNRSVPARSGSQVGVDRTHIDDLITQLERTFKEHPTSLGIVDASRGFVEVPLFVDGTTSSVVHFRRIARLAVAGTPDCRHGTPGAELFSVPYIDYRDSLADDDQTSRIHLPHPSSAVCIELSNASPLAHLKYGRVMFGGNDRRMRYLPSVKIDFGEAMNEDAIINRADPLIYSFLYELDVRNSLRLVNQRKRLRRDAGMRSILSQRRPSLINPRFPTTRLQPEVAAIFSFAGSALDNPPLAFLSYYQVLEYFFPMAARANAVRRVRRELRDPVFDINSDDSLLRLLRTAESSVSLSEVQQIRALTTGHVRVDRVIEVLDEFKATGHFGKNGPIKGVEIISDRNTGKDLLTQVADRIYQIRNRIVHAKDDPKYTAAPVLLPQSQEADSLEPDVRLARVLAMEVIISGQGL